VPATDAAVVATDTTAHPAVDASNATKAAPRRIFFERMRPEYGAGLHIAYCNHEVVENCLSWRFAIASSAPVPGNSDSTSYRTQAI
jgi:hypothetical protein